MKQVLRKRMRCLFGVLFFAVLIFGFSNLYSEDLSLYKNPNAKIEDRVENLLKQMTLEEKLDQILGKSFMDGQENSRLGIPPLLMTDGPHGVRGDEFGKATCFPTLISIGAAWNEDLTERFGQALGEETRGKGRNMILGPCINIHRTPLGGRNFESMSEDPYLISRLAVKYVKGVLSRKVGTSTKHFAVNNQEWERANISVVIDERTLREIYLPGFEAAVKEAGTTSIMGAYNMVNGDYCCENTHLLMDILKQDWNFKGFVVSDWWAIKNNLKAANSGCDMEMPGPGYAYNKDKLIPAIKNGQFSEKELNDKVRRILRVKFELGLFDGGFKDFVCEANSKAHQDLARTIAEEAIVLLKNDRNILPLKAQEIRSIAVVGPNAMEARIGGGGSSTVTPPYSVSPMEGLKNKADGKIDIQFAQGCTLGGNLDPVPSSALQTMDGKPGLKAEYFNNMDLNGKPMLTRVEANINYDWGNGAPEGGVPNDNFSVRWTGKFIPPESGSYRLNILSDDGSRLFIDGNLVVNNWSDHGPDSKFVAMNFEKGKKVDIKVEYYEKGGGAVMKLGWSTPDNKLLSEAVALAKKSDVALVFAGLNSFSEGEGYDKPDMQMPEGQNDLIEAVCAANPKTVVVLINGTPLDMRKWAGKVPSIVEAWYPGMEGGNAIANILFGNVNPSGKLPDTFPMKLEDHSSFGNYPGANGKVNYSEGIFVGYRYFDKNSIEPLFPFGHGLSYTTFEYSGLTLLPKSTSDGAVKVTVNVKNTGSVEGKEVVQLYVSDKESSVPRPPKELKRFSKIDLKPGETKIVTFVLDKRALSFYDANKKQWVAEPGAFEVLVGSSSRDIRLKDIFVLK